MLNRCDRTRNEISDIMSALFDAMREASNNANEFIELGKEFDKGLLTNTTKSSFVEYKNVGI